jgi:hypothetical protein
VIVDAIALNTRQFTAQYELLRSHVIGAAGDASQRDLGVHSRGAGLGLLLQEGMPGWLNAIDAVIRASLAQRHSSAAAGRTGHRVQHRVAMVVRCATPGRYGSPDEPGSLDSSC